MRSKDPTYTIGPMRGETVVAIVAAIGAILSVCVALWSAIIARQSVRIAGEAVTAAERSVAETRQLREEQYGYSGGDYCLNYRQQVLDLAAKGWSAPEIHDLLYLEKGFEATERSCGSIEAMVALARQVQTGEEQTGAVDPT